MIVGGISRYIYKALHSKVSEYEATPERCFLGNPKKGSDALLSKE